MPTSKIFRKQGGFFQNMKKHFQQQQCLLILFLLLSARSHQRLGGAVRNARSPFQGRGFQRDRAAPAESLSAHPPSPGGSPRALPPSPSSHPLLDLSFLTPGCVSLPVQDEALGRGSMRSRPAASLCRDSPGPPVPCGLSHARGSAGVTGDTGRSGRHKALESPAGGRGERR